MSYEDIIHTCVIYKTFSEQVFENKKKITHYDYRVNALKRAASDNWSNDQLNSVLYIIDFVYNNTLTKEDTGKEIYKQCFLSLSPKEQV